VVLPKVRKFAFPYRGKEAMSNETDADLKTKMKISRKRAEKVLRNIWLFEASDKIIRDQASEIKRLNDRWKELKAWLELHTGVWDSSWDRAFEKMTELEAKEK